MRKLIGLVGTTANIDRVYNSILALKAAEGLGDLYSNAIEDIAPNVSNGIFGDSAIRQMSSKMNRMIPINLHTGMPTNSKEDVISYVKKLSDLYGNKGWAAELFMNSEFHRKPNGMFISKLTRKEDADKLQDLLPKELILVNVLDTDDELVSDMLSITVGSIKDKVLKEKTIKLLENIKENYLK